MVTRTDRINGFETRVAPPEGHPVRLLCEDHVGTYLLPFPCRRDGDAWRNARTGEAIEGRVLGWRACPGAALPPAPEA